MSLCTVTELRSALGIGALYTDATLQEVCDAADAVLLPMLWTNTTPVIAHSNVGTAGTLYFEYYCPDRFYVGQSLTVSGCGSRYNGSRTVTAVGDYSIVITLPDHPADTPYHPVNPYGSVAADTYTDWTADSSIQLAALLISIDCWQARNAAGMGSVGIDGTPIPYRLGNTLLGKVRGLISHALAPGSMVG